MERNSRLVSDSRLATLVSSYFPDEIPAPLCKDYTGLKTVHVIEPEDIPPYLHIELNNLAKKSRRLMRHVVLEPRAEVGCIKTNGSMINGLDYWVANGKSLQECGEFSDQTIGDIIELIKHRSDVATIPLHHVEQTINVNLLINGLGGYEWHYDHNPITAVYYITDHVDEGEFMYIAEDGLPGAVQARAGRLVFGDLSQRPHGVAPLNSQPVRECVVFGLGVPAFAEDDRTTGSYLHGASEK